MKNISASERPSGSHLKLNHLLGGLLVVLLVATTAARAAETTTQISLDAEPSREAEEDYEDVELGKESLAEALKLSPVEYLGHFGYLSEQAAVTEETFDRAVRLFQKFMGLPETGDVDEQTVETMKMARCANEDLMAGKEAPESGKVRFQLQGDKWNSPTLRYKISNYPKKYLRRRREINDVFVEAFGLWSKVVPVQFVQERSRPEVAVDIEIDFVAGQADSACDKCKLFAKSNAIVAHAHYPPSPTGNRLAGEGKLAGDIHLNGLIDWSTDESIQGEDLLAVALHEIGHSLGLGHSQLRATKMYPLVNASKQSLHPFDVEGIRKIYFVKRESPSGDDAPADEDTPQDTTTTTTTTPDVDTSVKPPTDEEMCPEKACELSEESGFYPGPKCYQFYDCRTEVARLMNCPESLVWNEAKNYCDFRKNVKPQCERD